ncbi:hypothetical protein [Vibrio cholerae]|uniref:hypothetical protein n=1 Tax=Vibrio cholerae TaxID=666 RepID=UPI0001A326FC|nr:hypothetical protein [Vibrio cholerae]EEO13809.1 hypothetical protein VCB_002523 [Vibrio cholerae TMA 21]
MHKLQNGSQVSARPERKPLVGLGGYFSESNDQGAPSYPGQDWFNDCTDEFINALDEMGITYDQEQLDHLARAFAAVRSQAWNANVNYGIGQEVVRNNLRYIARAASGPDNGGAIEPNTVSSQLIWDPVLPTVFTSNDISSKWILLSDITFADFFSLEVVGGSKLTLAKNQFSCDVRFSFYEFGVGFEPPTVTVNTKTLGDDNPTFHTVKVSNSRVQLWMKINTNDPFPVTVLVKNRTRTSGSAAKAGILSVVDAAPTSTTLVPYDTGYQFASIPIGMEVAFDTPPPTNDPRFRFVKLTYNDAYNTGLLTSQTLSGSAPELVSTAVISAAQSPINGQTIDMINTMGTFIRPGVTAGVRQLSDNRSHNHTAEGTRSNIGFLAAGPGRDFSNTTVTTSASGGDEARPYNISRVFYKRIY